MLTFPFLCTALLAFVLSRIESENRCTVFRNARQEAFDCSGVSVTPVAQPMPTLAGLKRGKTSVGEIKTIAHLSGKGPGPLDETVDIW
jgi:hypothetical protein